jgi:hypothetical protein
LVGEERERYLLLLQVTIEFNLVAWMTKVNMPRSLFPSLLALQQFIIRLFIPDFPPFHFVYRAKLFQKILYDVTQKCIRDDWIATRLFGMCFDLYTGVNKRVTLAAHVRFFSPEWMLREVLLSTVQLEEGKEDAKTIVEQLLRMISNHGIDINWLVSITADGASVNTGLDGGVLAYICAKVNARAGVCYAHKCVCESVYICVCVCVCVRICVCVALYRLRVFY